jgi:hypothetical protein
MRGHCRCVRGRAGGEGVSCSILERGMAQRGISMSSLYARFKTRRQDGDDLAARIEGVVNQFDLAGTLGRGKLVVLSAHRAGAFDQGFDIAGVLTKPSKTSVIGSKKQARNLPQFFWIHEIQCGAAKWASARVRPNDALPRGADRRDARCRIAFLSVCPSHIRSCSGRGAAARERPGRPRPRTSRAERRRRD